MALQISDNFALSGRSKGIWGVYVKIPRSDSRDGQPGMVKDVEYPVLIDSLLQVTSFSLIQVWFHDPVRILELFLFLLVKQRTGKLKKQFGCGMFFPSLSWLRQEVHSKTRYEEMCKYVKSPIK